MIIIRRPYHPDSFAAIHKIYYLSMFAARFSMFRASTQSTVVVFNIARHERTVAERTVDSDDTRVRTSHLSIAFLRRSQQCPCTVRVLVPPPPQLRQ